MGLASGVRFFASRLVQAYQGTHNPTASLGVGMRPSVDFRKEDTTQRQTQRQHLKLAQPFCRPPNGRDQREREPLGVCVGVLPCLGEEDWGCFWAFGKELFGGWGTHLGAQEAAAHPGRNRHIESWGPVCQPRSLLLDSPLGVGVLGFWGPNTRLGPHSTFEARPSQHTCKLFCPKTCSFPVCHVWGWFVPGPSRYRNHRLRHWRTG